MKTKQFEYKPLAHYSYALVSQGKMAVIDPERDPMQYYSYAKEQNAKIIAIFETHPHADFVSSHLQIHEETGATIYTSKKTGADYPYKPFDEGDTVKIGNIRLRVLNTPGHSPDSITLVAEEGYETILFTGDTLFIGDVGRPDLREKAGNITAKRQDLAEMMYETIQDKFSHLPNDAVVYPAQGAGSLCGKNLSEDSSSTLGDERKDNWAFKQQTKEEFIDMILDNPPFIPSYFGFNVDINKSGAKNVRQAIAKVPFKMHESKKGLIVDTRSAKLFKDGHLQDSINVQAASEDNPFETWLGSIVEPKEEFHLVIDEPATLGSVLDRVAKIGYEAQLISVITLEKKDLVKSKELNLQHFKEQPDDYTIVDVRNKSEVNEGKIFESALSHPLNKLRDTAAKIPTNKPVVVHCSSGYRSAAASSILLKRIKDVEVYDLGDAVEGFQD